MTPRIAFPAGRIPSAALIYLLTLGLFRPETAFAQTALVTVSNSAAVVLTTNLPVPASSGTTYVLEKYAAGQLTLAGQITGGAGSILRTTTDTAGDPATVFEFAATNSGYAGGLQLYRGSVRADNPAALGTGVIYADGPGGSPGDLGFNAGMIFTNPLVLQSATTVSPGSNVVTLTGGISGSASLTKYGAGTLTLAGSNSYTGGTTVAAGTLVIGAAAALPGGPGHGNVAVNGTLDVNGFSPWFNNLTGAGTVDNVSAGGTPVLTVSNTSPATFAGTLQNTTGALELNVAGTAILNLTGTNTYTGITTIGSASTLQLGPGGTLGTAAVLDLGTLAMGRTDTVTVTNDIAGPGGYRQSGGGTVTLAGNLTYTGPTTVNAGVLQLPGNITFDASSGAVLTIANGATTVVAGTVFNLNVNSSSVAVDVAGAGTLQLASPLNLTEAFPDISFGPNQSGTADYGCRLAANLNLGSIHRTIFGWSGGNDVARNNLTGADCQFGGSISGTVELSLQGQNSFQGVNVMEVPFALLASNSFTGPLEIQRGSVYLGNVNALTASNTVIFDAPENQNSRLFLYGFNAVIADLQSSGYGDALIADGNNLTTTNVGPATLLVTQNHPATFGGAICDWYTEYTAPVTGSLTPVLSLVKNGPAALTLAGANTYSGTTLINSGKLYINGQSAGTGTFTVAGGATLGGSGVIGSTNVVVQAGGTIETGGGNGAGNLQLNYLTLGVNPNDTTTLNLTAAAGLKVVHTNGLVINGGTRTVSVNVGGTIVAAGTYPLITYQGMLGGAGFGGLSLDTLPTGVAGYLANDPAHGVINLVVVQVVSPQWTGAASTEWSTNPIASPKNWTYANGTATTDYADGEMVLFNDATANPLVNVSAADVQPLSVTVSNLAESYVFSGSHGISGSGSLVKSGGGRLTLATTNTYSGGTTIAAGTLTLGTAAALPGGAGAGNVTVNGTLDVNGFSPVLANLSGNGVVDNLTAGGSPAVTVNVTTNATFNGSLQNTTGSLGLTLAGGGTLTLAGSNSCTGPVTVANGTLTVNGRLGAGAVTVPGGSALGGTGTVPGGVTLAAAASLNLAANGPLTVGALTLNGPVTVKVTGNFSATNAGNYLLLNHGPESGSGSFVLSAVPGIFNSSFTASLADTNNQLRLVIAATQPTGTLKDVRHVVIFMQENRSFDHYFGTLHGVHGFSDRHPLLFQNGRSVFYQPSGSGYELPFHNTVTCLTDTPHDWVSTHEAFNSGADNAWVAAKGAETMNYETRSDLPYYYALADAFTVCDEYHCSVQSCTFPNRLYLWTGMIDPNDTGGGPVLNNTVPSGGWGTAWVTYAELLQHAGVSWKVYQQSDNANDNALAWFTAFKEAQPGNPLYDNGVATVPDLVTALKNDVLSNTLPSVSWIAGTSAADEHPPHSPQSGEAMTKSLLDAIAANPAVYASTVFILMYDENDGFFDHEIPILPPAGTTNEFVGGLPIGLGARLPLIIVSPWTQGGHVCSQVFDATSITQFLEKWTGVRNPNISAWRRQVCGDLTSAFDFAHPNTNYPSLTGVTAITCSSGITPAVPGTQSMPVQEAGTLLARPLPYQPNTTSYGDLTGGNFDLVLTNSGAASVHYTIYPNAYRTDGPWPYDVAGGTAAAVPFNVLTNSGNYDFSCYGPNGFLRRFAGNLSAQANKLEVAAVFNPGTGGLKLALTNGTAAAVTFYVTNNYVTNGQSCTVAAGGFQTLQYLTATNNDWYDLTATLGGSTNFLRQFAGHLETNTQASILASSENASGYRDNVTFTASLAGYGTPGGTAQFRTNGSAWGTPVNVVNGNASRTLATLPRGTNVITVEYSGDLLNPPWTNSLTQTVTNHPPTAGTATWYRGLNQPLQIRIADLLTNAQDADGDPLTLAGVGTNGFNLLSFNGARLATNAASVWYTNGLALNVDDRFDYAVNDGLGGTGTGLVLVKSVNDIFNFTNPATLVHSSTNVTAIFYGIPGSQYTVLRSTNLTGAASWVSISTNTAPTNGLFQVKDDFHDLGRPVPPLPGSVFYLLRYNQ